MSTCSRTAKSLRNDWKHLKKCRVKEGSKSVKKCNRLKRHSTVGKPFHADVATADPLVRPVRSIHRPNAKPIQLWPAKMGRERMQELSVPAVALNRAQDRWQQHGRRAKLIQQRMSGPVTWNKRTDSRADRAIIFISSPKPGHPITPRG